ncbi:MAG: nucleotidyl transferase AbiEii/AbiGii toxin family protein [Sphingobacteriales bacterium]|jgi:hypothetical protein|nr:MAG: nucleotidyl transferase AbiEii/AbiGii toxin family protein [Sphingobacteriales bacterium]
MLQKQTVAPELLELLEKLMLEDTFSNFNLVGGTSLALQIGHRNSIDIDLFGNAAIETDLFIDIISKIGKTQVLSFSKNILITNINNIKVDFVCYNYPLLDAHLLINNIRLVAKKDIAAMKLNAIAGRGSKKDFIDIFYLLQEFELKDMFDFYSQKYNNNSIFMVYKSLSYFDEADIQPQPLVYDKHFTWEKCKQKIILEIKKI